MVSRSTIHFARRAVDKKLSRSLSDLLNSGHPILASCQITGQSYEKLRTLLRKYYLTPSQYQKMLLVREGDNNFMMSKPQIKPKAQLGRLADSPIKTHLYSINRNGITPGAESTKRG